MLSDFTVKEKKDFRYRFYRALTVWSIGNALTSGLWAALMAVTISDLSWGTAIALAFSAYFAGNLSRLFSASIVEKFRSYRKTTIFLYFFQGIALITAALIFAFGQALGRGQPGLFFFFWFLSCVLENLGFVTLLSWMGNLFSRKTLGRLNGERERRRLWGEVPIVILTLIVLTIVAEIFFNGRYPENIARIIYFLAFLLGGIFISASSLILCRIAEKKMSLESVETDRQKWKFRWKYLKAPVRNPIFRWILIYAFFCSLFIQMEQATRSSFQKELFSGDGVRFALVMGTFQLVTRLLQVTLAPWTGKQVDRFGTLFVMKISQTLTAFALIFYAAAVFYPNPWLLLGAAIVWSSYVGINTALPKIQLEFSQHNEVSWSTAYGIFHGLGGFLGLGLGTIVFDYSQKFPKCIALFFVMAFLLRLLLVTPLLAAEFVAKKEKTGSKSE